MIADQVLIVWSDRPDKYPPAIPEYDMSLPLRRVRANTSRQIPLLLLLKRFQKADEITDLPWVQRELGHARMTGRNTFTKRFLK
jgi:hypothetical protein